MRTVFRGVLLMLLVVLVPTSLIPAETTRFFGGYAVSVPSPLVLLVSGLAMLGLAALIRESGRRWRS
jgi:hypothetical protein